MNRADFKHSFLIPVRWGDADVYGHINNVALIRYIESGRVAYCEEVLGTKLVAGMSRGWVLADIQCTYLRQVHYPATLEVCTRVSKVGQKSATLTVAAYLQDDERTVLTSKGVMVWMDLKNNTTAKIPDDIKNKIITYEVSVEGASA